MVISATSRRLGQPLRPPVAGATVAQADITKLTTTITIKTRNGADFISLSFQGMFGA